MIIQEKVMAERLLLFASFVQAAAWQSSSFKKYQLYLKLILQGIVKLGRISIPEEKKKEDTNESLLC